MSLSADRPIVIESRDCVGLVVRERRGPEFECQQGTVGVAEVDGPLVADFDGLHALVFYEYSVGAVVVDRDPAPVEVTQDHM